VIKLMIVGLDGATFTVIKPLCAEGKLPNLNQLLTQGAHGILESTFPSVTGPAWSALATGKNPGKTGIFDSLLRMSKGNFETRVVSSMDIKRAKPYWDCLSNAGIRTGVANYPFLYPPYELNGVMLSGLGSNPRDEISYPKEFKQFLLKRCGKYRIDVPWGNPEYAKNPSLFLQHIFETLDINHETIKILLQSDLEALTMVISASDFAQHYMWRYIDSSHPYYSEEEANEYKDAFIQIWQKIDGMLASVTQALTGNVNIIVVSDHGFGPHRSTFYTGSWLEKEGYLFKRRWSVRGRRLQSIAAETIRRISPSLHSKLVKATDSGVLPKIPVTSEIDTTRSLAISLANASLVGKICINRQSAPFKSGSKDFGATKEEIIAKLKETCQNLGIQGKVYSPHELYTGQYIDLAPDILFDVEDGECSVSYGFSEKLFQKPPPDPIHSGIHKREGIFIAYGPDIKQGVEIEAAKIYDVAPTILHMFGLPVPDDMDGRVLKEIFREDSEPAQREVKYQEVKADKEKVREKIRKLRDSKRL